MYLKTRLEKNMKCNNCGKELNEGVAFCRYCGSKIEIEKINVLPTETKKEFLEEVAEKEKVEVKEPLLTKKMKRNIIIIAIATTLIIASIVTVVLIVSNVKRHKCGDSLSWNYDESTSTLTISGNGDMYDSGTTWDFNEAGEISSGSIKGLTFDKWIRDNKIDSSKLKEIVIEEGCLSVGKSAFGWFAMKNIKLPNSLESIGEFAFCKCSNLEEVDIPENVTVIGDYAFNDCDQLVKIKIPKSVTFIGKNALKKRVDQKTIDISIAYPGTKDEWLSIAKDVEFVGVVICSDGEIRHENNWKTEEEKFIGSWEERGVFGTWEIATIPEGLFIEKSNENTSNEMRSYRFVSNIKNYNYKIPYGELSISRENNLTSQDGQKNEYSGNLYAYRLAPTQIDENKEQIAKMGHYELGYNSIDDNTIIAETKKTSSDAKNVTNQERLTIKYNSDNDTITVENYTDFNNNVISSDGKSTTDRSKVIGITYKRKSNDAGVFNITLNSDNTGTKTKAYGTEGVDTIGWSLKSINEPNTIIIHSSEDNYYHSHYMRYDPNTGKLTYEGYESKVKYILTKK